MEDAANRSSHLNKKQFPVWKPNDFASMSGAFTYRDSADPLEDKAHAADPQNVPPAKMHVTGTSYANQPQGYLAYVTRGNTEMAPGHTQGLGASGWGFRTPERAQKAAQAMMNRINRDGDAKYTDNVQYDDDPF